MNYLIIRDILNSVLPGKVFHYFADNEKCPYIVWEEDGEGNSLYSDDLRAEKVIQGTIDLFTEMEYDPLVTEIEAALEEENINFWYNGVDYEEKTKKLHHEWIWEVP